MVFTGCGSGREEKGQGGGGGLLGAYELGRTVGEGSFGTVRRARHRRSGACFAVKVVDRARVLAARFADQVRREVAALALLRHPNVVRLRPPGRKYYARKYLQLLISDLPEQASSQEQ